MEAWLEPLRYNPLPPLVNSKNEAVRFFANRDLLEQNKNPLNEVQNLPAAKQIIERQLPNGAWKYHGTVQPRIRPQDEYNQIETYRMLGILVEKYGFSRRQSSVARAAEYLFSKQMEEGDFRGIYGHQYTPNYSAGIMELLAKVGFEADPRIEKGFEWLLSIRQNDGGWAVPSRTVGRKSIIATMNGPTLNPDKTRPFSHLVTGVVLRAFAIHPGHRQSAEAKAAGNLLSSRFFRRDAYPDRTASSFWTKFSFPFWFTDLLSALDSLSRIGFSKAEPPIKNGLDWFVAQQHRDGTWKLSMLRTGDKELSLWINLAICRVFKRFYRQ